MPLRQAQGRLSRQPARWQEPYGLSTQVSVQRTDANPGHRTIACRKLVRTFVGEGARATPLAMLISTRGDVHQAVDGSSENRQEDSCGHGHPPVNGTCSSGPIEQCVRSSAPLSSAPGGLRLL